MSEKIVQEVALLLEEHRKLIGEQRKLAAMLIEGLQRTTVAVEDANRRIAKLEASTDPDPRVVRASVER